MRSERRADADFHRPESRSWRRIRHPPSATRPPWSWRAHPEAARPGEAHGVFGGCDFGVGVGRVNGPAGYRIISPSRFGFLGSPMPADPSPAAQADAFAALLDHLDVRDLPVVAFSAGSSSWSGSPSGRRHGMRRCASLRSRCSPPRTPSCSFRGSGRPRPGDSARHRSCARVGAVTRAARTPSSRRSGEDDLAAVGEGVELSDGEDLVDLVDEVVLGELVHVCARLARVEFGAGVGH
jgi:hypothetical protein